MLFNALKWHSCCRQVVWAGAPLDTMVKRPTMSLLLKFLDNASCSACVQLRHPPSTTMSTDLQQAKSVCAFYPSPPSKKKFLFTEQSKLQNLQGLENDILKFVYHTSSRTCKECAFDVILFSFWHEIFTPFRITWETAVAVKNIYNLFKGQMIQLNFARSACNSQGKENGNPPWIWTFIFWAINKYLYTQ